MHNYVSKRANVVMARSDERNLIERYIHGHIWEMMMMTTTMMMMAFSISATG